MRARLLASVIAIAALLAACGGVGFGGPDVQPGPAPPPEASEGVVEVETPAGRAAAELVGDSVQIAGDDRISFAVANRGEVTLEFGSPFAVQRWDGERWVDLDRSDRAWTMELRIAEPGTTHEQQSWPFDDEPAPEPGWYRLEKEVTPEGADEPIVVHARVEVTG